MKQTSSAADLVSDISQALHEKSLVLYELSARLGQVRTFPDIVELLGAFLPRFFDCEFFAVYFFDEQSQKLELHHLSDPAKAGACRGLEESRVSSWIFRNKKPSVVPSEFLFPGAAKGPETCVVAIPLLSVDKPVGLIYVFTRQEASGIDLHSLELVRVMSGLTGVTCENLRLALKMEKQNEELGRTRTYLFNILDSMIHGVVVLDPENRITLLSKSAEILLGVSAALAEGEEFSQVFSPEFAEVLRDIIGETVRSDYVLDREFSCRMRGGIKIPLGVSASRLTDETGKFLGIIVILRDLSGAKRLATLSNLNRMKSEFVSTVAHEFKVPLNLVVSSSTMLATEMKENLSATQLRLIEFIRNGGARLNTLINDLLELSRIETAGFFEKTEKIPLADLLEQVFAALRVIAERKGIELVPLPADGEPVEFFGNRERLFQAFHNIVHNAVKYTLPGGSVRAGWKILRAGGDPAAFEVWIADTGIGMPEKELEKIFDEFVRLKDPRTNEEGTGLGLTIVKKIVEMHHGSIRVTSRLQEGTTFTVELPLDMRKQL